MPRSFLVLNQLGIATLFLLIVDVGSCVPLDQEPVAQPQPTPSSRVTSDMKVVRDDASTSYLTLFEQRGITFTNGKYCPNVTFDSPLARESLEHLASTGANAVAIVVTQYMRTINHTEIFPLYTPVTGPLDYYTYITATDEALIKSIDDAHSLGLRVMLKPHVDLIADSADWRGDIGYYYNETQWADWFVQYKRFIGHYAAIANRTGVEQLSLSCELVEASKRALEWREVAAEVRGIAPRTLLTDAANWGYLNATGGEAFNKTWWDAVDIIGVDAYYPLLNNVSEPTVSDLVTAWQPVVARLKSMSATYNRPVIFTEIGFCSGNCSRGADGTKIDLETQEVHYRAVFEAFMPYADQWFKGIYWWTWNTDPSFGGNTSRCISPQFKPAEMVLREYYGATKPRPVRKPGEQICPCIV